MLQPDYYPKINMGVYIMKKVSVMIYTVLLSNYKDYKKGFWCDLYFVNTRYFHTVFMGSTESRLEREHWSTFKAPPLASLLSTGRQCSSTKEICQWFAPFLEAIWSRR